MTQHFDEPFSVYIPHTMPHTKLDASPQFNVKSERGLYGDVIEELHFNVGRILDAIRENGIEEKTYALFTSDNGPWLIKNKDHVDGHLPGDHRGSAGPLRSGKVRASKAVCVCQQFCATLAEFQRARRATRSGARLMSCQRLRLWPVRQRRYEYAIFDS